MAHPLDGPRLKIKRAGEHLKTVDKLVAKYSASKPYRLVVDEDCEQSCWIVRLDSLVGPPIIIGIRLGEFVYQLRSALDHVAYELARLTTRVPDSQLQFPIYKEPPIPSTRVEGIPSEALIEIESLQPYHRTHGFQDDPLWVLNKLRRVDMHRVLTPVFASLTIPKLARVASWVRPRGPFNKGDEIARLPRHIDFKKDFEETATFQVLLAVRQADIGDLPIGQLHTIYDHVRDGIIPRFARFFS
jgi:hypothetical protein